MVQPVMPATGTLEEKLAGTPRKSDHFVQVTFSCSSPGPTTAPEKLNFYRSGGDHGAGSAAVIALEAGGGWYRTKVRQSLP
jgi:hypothetical protein